MEGQRGQRTNWEMVSGIVAIFVGVAALFVSAYTAYLEHRHAQAEVWPRLVLGSSDEGGGFKVTVANKGTGPALIRDWKERLDGHPVTTWTPWVDTLAGHHVPVGDYSKWNIADGTLAPGDDVTLFATADPALGIAINLSPHVAETTICYCSVFDDCWVLDRDNHHTAHRPVPVRECPDPGQDSWVGIGEAELREIAEMSGPKGQDAGAHETP